LQNTSDEADGAFIDGFYASAFASGMRQAKFAHVTGPKAAFPPS
jgi:hypothetical protein